MYAKNLQNTQQSPIKTKLYDPTEKKNDGETGK